MYSPRRRDLTDTGLKVFVVLVVIFVLSPLVIVILHSFNDVAYAVFPPKGLSLQWYGRLMTQKNFLRGFINSVVTASGATGLSLLVGFSAALALARYRLFGKSLVTAFLFLPIVAPKIVLGLALFILFLQWKLYGGLTGLTLAHTLIVLPFVVAVLTATLKGLNMRLDEAAMDLGARPLRVLWEIVLPQVKGGLIVSACLAFVVSFDQVEASIFLVQPRNYTLPLEMFVYMEKWQDPSIAALSTVMIAGVVVLVGLGLVVGRRLRLTVPPITLAGGQVSEMHD